MFSIGDLLEIRSDMKKEQKKNLLHRQFPLLKDSVNGVRCIVLERLDCSRVLVSPCDVSKSKKRLPNYLDLGVKCVDQTIFVSTQISYEVEEEWFELSKLSPLANPQNLIAEIQFGKEQFRRKKLLKNQRENEKRQRLLEYRKKYEIAIMNNDREAMQAIVDELGYAPIGHGSSKVRSVPYTCKNPKPYQGGRFSPK